MKRKVLALLLCIVTVLTLFTACGEKEIDEDELVSEQSTRTAVSINMWIVTDNKVSEETEALIEKAVNTITKSRFTTYVDLIFVTESEYDAAIDARFTAIEEQEKAREAEIQRQKEEARSLKAAGITTIATTTEAPVVSETAEETVLNEYGVVELKYPVIPEDQIDIICVMGRERLEALVDAGRLMDLDDEISTTGSSKALNDYIHPTFFNFSKIDGSCYAIPNNHVIGEYTYLLINKQLAEKYYIHPDSISDFKDCLTFIEDIKKNETIAPVKAPFASHLTYFWDVQDLSSPDFSILASSYGLTAKQIYGEKSNIKLNLTDVYSVRNYTEHQVRMMTYEQNGYFAANEDDPFGVGVVTGDYSLRNQYGDDYYVKVLRAPVATEEDVFESFLAVSSYTANLKRCMEVITLLNTTSELRNILAYGIEDVHYTINDNDVLVRLNNDYCTKLVNTGNVFMAHPDEGMPGDMWTYGKLQNQDSFAHVLLGLRSAWGDVNQSKLETVDQLTKEYQARELACKTPEELQAFYDAAKLELAQNVVIKGIKDAINDTDTPAAVYKSWYDTNWPTVD